MAVTGFWPIYKNLKATLNYADNPDKTTPKEYVDDDLYAALRYAGNDNKTDRQLYVGGINCSRQNAFEEMIAVQRHFGLRGKVVGYHGIQSFREGEVTPEEAFAIGKETARRMWGDRYQVLVTVHLNTENIHCHFVVNPVSFKDGSQFRNKIADHVELRRISDEVCREHRLSVLENSSFYGSKKAYWISKAGKKTHREMLRDDVEYCLTYARGMDQLIRELRGLGYEYDYSRDSVRAPDWERAVRLRNLGYTRENLSERFRNNRSSDGYDYWRSSPLPYGPKQFPLLELEKQMQFSVKHSRDAATAMVYLMYQMLVQLLQLMLLPLQQQREWERNRERGFRPLSPSLRQELAHLDELDRETRFLADNGIHTAKELEETMSDLSKQIGEKEAQRQNCRNQLRRNTDPVRETALKEKAKAISRELAPLREKLRTARRIKLRSHKIQKLLETERAMEVKARTRERSYER